MKYYKVRDLAERYDVSRQTIHYYINRLSYVDKSKYLSYKGNSILINQSGVNYFDSLMSPNKLVSNDDNSNEQPENIKDLPALLDLINSVYATKEYIQENNTNILKDVQKNEDVLKTDIKELALKCQKNEIDVIHTNKQLKKGLIILSVLVVILIIVCSILWFNIFEF